MLAGLLLKTVMNKMQLVLQRTSSCCVNLSGLNADLQLRLGNMLSKPLVQLINDKDASKDLELVTEGRGYMVWLSPLSARVCR